MTLQLQAFDEHVVEIHLYVLSDLLFKDCVDQPLVCRTCILQTKRHHLVAIEGSVHDERRFFLIPLMHLYLVIA